MAVDSKYYLHKADRSALKALKAIPGFHRAVKAVMKVVSEREFRILNMSSMIRMGEDQLEKYYNLLPPICEKLGIEVPDLYLMLDVRPNSFTSGDTKPFIVITSGLLKTLPDELIPTVLAHECGHIACHHVLYHTVGSILLGTTEVAASALFPLGGIASLPLEIGFFSWMRCSEYSADRAAVLCDGGPDKMTEVCMRLAGFEKDIPVEINKAAFLRQGREYEEYIRTSRWNRLLEFFTLSTQTHPLMAVRALECEKWGKSRQFASIMDGTYLQKEM